jgi:hypothetical protein
MSRARRPVMLVGGVPGNSAEEVLRVVAPIVGDLAIGLTDGEFGLRRFWVFFVAINTWDKHPDMELIRPNPEPMPGVPEWLPPDYHACPWWGPKLGVQQLRPIETLGYPEEALASYKVFCRLRDQGVIPQGARFQQSLPFPDDAARVFTNNAHNMDLMVDAYIDVMRRDVAKLCQKIPHDDLVLQWDINWETVALEHGDYMPEAPPMQFKPTGDPMERFVRYIHELNAPIPKAVHVGMHLCYGDLHHKHSKDPADLAISADPESHVLGGASNRSTESASLRAASQRLCRNAALCLFLVVRRRLFHVGNFKDTRPDCPEHRAQWDSVLGY